MRIKKNTRGRGNNHPEGCFSPSYPRVARLDVAALVGSELTPRGAIDGASISANTSKPARASAAMKL
jgi:hypothetical protein